MIEAVVKTEAGDVRGSSTAGGFAFLGVPYAAPPLRDLRFKTPEPPRPWTGVRDGTVKGPNAPQHQTTAPRTPGLDLTPVIGDGWIEGDDFLALNIWTPDTEAKSLPVMVFVHGGAFLLGSKDASIYDGTEFAKSGVVCITINYRMGIEGFVPVPGGDTNLGLRDVIAALQWVRRNAEAFGGDPDNVTVFGESAGAMILADLVTSPMAQGLFRRAIVQSGHGGMVRPISVAQRLVKRLARLMHVTPDVAGFRSKSIAEGLAAVELVSRPTSRLDLRDETGREPTFGLSKFLPVFGDDVLPERPLEALKHGAGAEIDLLIGSNREEMNIYFVPTGVREKLSGFLTWFMLSRVHPRSRGALKDYGLGQKGKKAGHVFTEALHDLVFRWPARRFAEAHQGRTHVYEFGWRSPACGGELGACHALELPFVFKTLPLVTGAEGLVGPNPPQALADSIHQIWVDFAHDGSLPWPEYSAADPQVYALETGVAAHEAPPAAARHSL